MGRNTRPSAAREKTIRERQEPMRWGSEYLPGQLATKAEAPDDSRPATIHSFELGRLVHAMSGPEQDAIVLGFYGGAKELHESGMLHPEPALGPLANYPAARGLPILGHRGTIQIAEDLGVMKWHPSIQVQDPNRPGCKKWIAFPLLNDLLWYFHGPSQPFCVNWTVKATPEDFERPFAGGFLKRRPGPNAVEDALARHAVEEMLFREVDVPTIKVAGTDIPRHVALNLRALYKWQGQKADVHDDHRDDVVEILRARMQMGVPVFETLRHFMNRYGGTYHDYQVILNQAIWKRQLNVDLWTPINMDQPLRPAEKDVLEHFAPWFQQGLK